jgi:anti-sigma regulatory factor (Ser/Thr protein kinase)
LTEKEAKVLVVPAALEEIERVRRFLRDVLHELALGEEDAFKVELSLHEICVNIALYAYRDGRSGDLSVRVWRDDGTLVIEVRDRGVPFDPAQKPSPDLQARIRHGKRGGLGVFFFKTLMDGFTYRREGEENVLTVFKRI